jgi:hypothetical protein
METLLTESMISNFSSSGLLLGTSSGSVLLKLRGNFRQNGTQLELIEYHGRLNLRLVWPRLPYFEELPIPDGAEHLENLWRVRQ